MEAGRSFMYTRNCVFPKAEPIYHNNISYLICKIYQIVMNKMTQTSESRSSERYPKLRKVNKPSVRATSCSFIMNPFGFVSSREGLHKAVFMKSDPFSAVLVILAQCG